MKNTKAGNEQISASGNTGNGYITEAMKEVMRFAEIVHEHPCQMGLCTTSYCCDDSSLYRQTRNVFVYEWAKCCRYGSDIQQKVSLSYYFDLHQIRNCDRIIKTE